DELRLGTFSRVRVVVHMDGLDEYLQSNRETIRLGPVLDDAQDILRAIFNILRTELQKADEKEDVGAELARKLAGSPATLARRPIIAMASAALDGKIRSRYIALPMAPTKTEKEQLVAQLETRSNTPEEFVAGVDV